MITFVIVACIIAIGVAFLIPQVRKKLIGLFYKEIATAATGAVTDALSDACAEITGTVKGLTETGKYALRFGIILIIVLPIVGRVLDWGKVATVIYKVGLVTVALGLAELLWLVFFKPIFGKMEDLNDNDKRSVLLFRGILYAAIIVALTLGL